MRIIPLILSCSFFAISCSSLQRYCALKGDPKVLGVAVSSLAEGMPSSVLHEVEIRSGAVCFVMLGQLEVSDGSLVLAGVSPMGKRLFVIEYDGGRLVYEPSDLFDVPLRPERLLLDLFLVYAEVGGLQEGGVGVEVSREGTRRMVTRSGERVVVEYDDVKDVWGSGVKYVNHSLDYMIRFSPLLD